MASDEVVTVKGWKVSERQCELIAEGDKTAVNQFFEENLKRLYKSAYSFLRHGILNHLPFVVLLEVDELVNQFYLDMLSGYIKLDINHIGSLVRCSFKYAAVGGFGSDLGSVEFKNGKLIFSIGGSL